MANTIHIKELDCPICCDPMEEITSITSEENNGFCNHSFCRECITRVIETAAGQNQTPTCPLCRRAIIGFQKNITAQHIKDSMLKLASQSSAQKQPEEKTVTATNRTSRTLTNHEQFAPQYEDSSHVQGYSPEEDTKYSDPHDDSYHTLMPRNSQPRVYHEDNNRERMLEEQPDFLYPESSNFELRYNESDEDLPPTSRPYRHVEREALHNQDSDPSTLHFDEWDPFEALPSSAVLETRRVNDREYDTLDVTSYPPSHFEDNSYTENAPSSYSHSQPPMSFNTRHEDTYHSQYGGSQRYNAPQTRTLDPRQTTYSEYRPHTTHDRRHYGNPNLGSRRSIAGSRVSPATQSWSILDYQRACDSQAPVQRPKTTSNGRQREDIRNRPNPARGQRNTQPTRGSAHTEHIYGQHTISGEARAPEEQTQANSSSLAGITQGFMSLFGVQDRPKTNKQTEVGRWYWWGNRWEPFDDILSQKFSKNKRNGKHTVYVNIRGQTYSINLVKCVQKNLRTSKTRKIKFVPNTGGVLATYL